MKGKMEQTLNVIWRNLSVRDLLNLCQSNKFFQNICNDPTTWNFLLYRDFGITGYVGDPKIKYMLEYCDQRRCKVFIFFLNGKYFASFYAHGLEEIYVYLAHLYNTGSPLLPSQFNDWIEDYIYENLLTEEQAESGLPVKSFNIQMTLDDIKNFLGGVYGLEIKEIEPLNTCLR